MSQPIVYETQRVRRDGEFDLEFSGILLASHMYEPEGSIRWTEVDLYATESKKFVAVVRFGSSKRASVQSFAKVCETPEEVVAWMKGDRDRIGIAAKRVLETANIRYPSLFPFRPFERV